MRRPGVNDESLLNQNIPGRSSDADEANFKGWCQKRCESSAELLADVVAVLTILEERFPEFMNSFSKRDRHTYAFACALSCLYVLVLPI